MREASPKEKKNFLRLRHEIARAGFGSNIYKKGGVFFAQVLTVYDRKQIKKIIPLDTSFRSLKEYEQINKIKDQIKARINEIKEKRTGPDTRSGRK